PLAGHQLHHGRASGRGCSHDGDGPVEARGRVQHRTARSRAILGAARPTWFAVAGAGAACRLMTQADHRRALATGIAFDPYGLDTPYFAVDLGLLRRNLAVLRRVQDESSAKVLLALKGFAMWSVFPIARGYLSGITASSVSEARLGREEFGGEVHAYAPAYSDADIAELVTLADHVVLNSVTQFRKFQPKLAAAGIECGLRINPEHREVETDLYDPCAPGSRLGVRAATLREAASPDE